jgi:hypothetical protein
LPSAGFISVEPHDTRHLEPHDDAVPVEAKESRCQMTEMRQMPQGVPLCWNIAPMAIAPSLAIHNLNVEKTVHALRMECSGYHPLPPASKSFTNQPILSALSLASLAHF